MQKFVKYIVFLVAALVILATIAYAGIFFGKEYKKVKTTTNSSPETVEAQPIAQNDSTQLPYQQPVETWGRHSSEPATPEAESSQFLTYYEDAKQFTDQFTVVDVLMREDNNFLQGLYFDNERNQFIESAGLYGKSKVQWLEEDLDDNRVLNPADEVDFVMDKQYFGEGLSPRNPSEFVVLTWRENTIFVLNRQSLAMTDRYPFPEGLREGWGVTAIEETGDMDYVLYMSDGTSKIYAVDGATMTTRSSITVKDSRGEEVSRINELEYVDGYIYANIWYRDVLIKINPNTGLIEKEWDIGTLAKAEHTYQRRTYGRNVADCLNGIAYNKSRGTFYLSGKKHFLIYEVKLE